MGYEIHIKRDPPLTLDEWNSAVLCTEGVRLDPSGTSAVNPLTGDRVFVQGTEGNARIKIGSDWWSCFRWSHKGYVSFRPSETFFDPDDVVRQIAKSLAIRLGAQLTGDDGELYE